MLTFVTSSAPRPFLEVDSEHYRGDLTAAFSRIEQLEHELAVFRADPAYERVDIAEELLDRVRSRRLRAQRLLPKVLILSFVLMGAFALTDPSLHAVLRALGYTVSVLGGAFGVVSLASLLVLVAQGPRPARIRELERNVRLAKGDVGARVDARLRVGASMRDALEEADEEGFGAQRRSM